MLIKEYTGKLAAMTALSLFCVTAIAEESSKLELSAYENQPGGMEILAGEYAQAAQTIERTLRPGSSFESLTALNNLCVAQTLLRDYEAAERTCDRAVTTAMSYERKLRMHDRSASARALSNRGVMSVLTGDIDSAITDLNKASARAMRDWNAPERNLAYIGELSVPSFAGTN